MLLLFLNSWITNQKVSDFGTKRAKVACEKQMANVNDELELLSLMKGKILWEAFKDMQAVLKKYGDPKVWRLPTSGQSKQQCLYYTRKVLYVRNLVRIQRNKICDKGTAMSKKGLFDPW